MWLFFVLFLTASEKAIQEHQGMWHLYQGMRHLCQGYLRVQNVIWFFCCCSTFSMQIWSTLTTPLKTARSCQEQLFLVFFHEILFRFNDVPKMDEMFRKYKVWNRTIWFGDLYICCSAYRLKLFKIHRSFYIFLCGVYYTKYPRSLSILSSSQIRTYKPIWSVL